MVKGDGRSVKRDQGKRILVDGWEREIDVKICRDNDIASYLLYSLSSFDDVMVMRIEVL